MPTGWRRTTSLRRPRKHSERLVWSTRLWRCGLFCLLRRKLMLWPQVLLSLTENAVQEKRYDDAGYARNFARARMLLSICADSTFGSSASGLCRCCKRLSRRTPMLSPMVFCLKLSRTISARYAGFNNGSPGHFVLRATCIMRTTQSTALLKSRLRRTRPRLCSTFLALLCWHLARYRDCGRFF